MAITCCISSYQRDLVTQSRRSGSICHGASRYEPQLHCRLALGLRCARMLSDIAQICVDHRSLTELLLLGDVFVCHRKFERLAVMR